MNRIRLINLSLVLFAIVVSDLQTVQAQTKPNVLVIMGSTSEEDAAMIKSTRIRVGRNLAGYPLGPGVTKEQRDEIMAKVVAACETFEGDLAGTFYPLEGMDEATREQLVADHFLFK